VPVLIGRLGEDVDPAVAQRAAWALGKIGPSAAAAVEPLRHAATRDDPRLARLAGEAITAISG
jgi:HEAT repeat protein